jgi:two-component system nitrate/nitrite response regulator NarL
MIRIVIAEDHTALIDGIKSFFVESNEIKFVGVAKNGEELIEQVKIHKPDLVITDIRMPKMDGFVAVEYLMKENPELNILVFTMFDTINTINRMLNLGVKGYILKNSGLNTLIEAIKTVSKGKKYLSRSVYEVLELEKEGKKSKKETEIEQKKRAEILTKREKQILYLIGQKKTTYEISEELIIAISTVETHRKNIHRKLNLKGRNELYIFAAENKYDF